LIAGCPEVGIFEPPLSPQLPQANRQIEAQWQGSGKLTPSQATPGSAAGWKAIKWRSYAEKVQNE